MKKKLELIATSHHRNGICGAPFNVSLFKDTDGTTKLFVDFGNSNYAVLQVDKLAADDIAFGSNSWRGDHYADEVRALAKNAGPSVADGALFVRHPVGSNEHTN
jgi:hypothetical protein